MPKKSKGEKRRRLVTPKRAEAYELQLATDPRNLETRAELLDYYAMQAFHSDNALSEQARHVFWIIENAPDAEIASSPFMNFPGRAQEEPFSEKAERLWREQVKARPENANVLGHAAFFLLFRYLCEEDNSEVIALLEKAEALAPNDYRWPERSGHLHSLSSHSKGVEAGQKSVACYERAYAALNKMPNEPESAAKKQCLLQELAINALVAGDNDKATEYATRLLKSAETRADEETKANWNDGNALHWSHIVLGKVALRRGDKEAAKTHLLAAGETSGSPQLNSFGPDMALAKSLTEAGEKEAVIAYLTACAKFWKSRAKTIAKWNAAIEKGQIPDFAKHSHEVD